MNLDNLLQNRIGFGRAQIYPLLFLCLIDANDGAQLVLSSILMPIIKKQWNLSIGLTSLLTSIFYLGGFIGCIIGGILGDRYGRRKIIILASILQLLVCISFIFCNNVLTLLICRFIYGFCFGFSIVLTTSQFAESSTIQYRGKGILLLNFCVSIGKLYAIFLAYLCLNNYQYGNWKLMMFLSSIPNIFVLYGSIFIIKQSPRFLLIHHYFQQAQIVINHLIKQNNKNKQQQQYKLTIKQKQQLFFQYQQNIIQINSILILFNKNYQKITICLCICWFCINFTYFGQLIILPFIFGKQQNQSFISYTLTIFGQIPSFIITILIIDNPKFGRRKSMIYFFTFSAILQLCFTFNPIVLFSSLCRFFMKMCFQMLYAITTQSYDTRIRTIGFGFCSAIGRTGAILMPYIIIPLVQHSQANIFIILALMSIIGAISSQQLSIQSTNKPLDYHTLHNQQ